MSNRLNNIYKAVLAYSGMEADANGVISNVILGNKEPSVIEGKQLVLPYDVQLKNFNANDKIIFHPLSENILRGESLILSFTKKSLNVKINTIIGIIGSSLLQIVVSPKVHSELSPEQTELLLAIKDPDNKTCTNFIEQMVSITKNKTDRCFSNIYLKRGGVYKDNKYSRVGVVKFPFYEDLVAGKVEGIRIKDRETYIQLFKFMFPAIDIPESYNYGCNSQVAPYLECLLYTSGNITSRLNDLINLYEKYIDRIDQLRFDVEWLDYFTEINKYIPDIRQVPVQYGNDGSISILERQEPEPQQQEKPVNLPPPSLPQSPVAPPVHYQPPAPVMNRPPDPPVSNNGKLNMSDLFGGQQQTYPTYPQPMMTPQYQPQMPPQGYPTPFGNPVMPMNQGYPQQMSPPQYQPQYPYPQATQPEMPYQIVVYPNGYRTKKYMNGLEVPLQ